MEAYQLRVIEEKKELDAKIKSLENFLKLEIFVKIEKSEQSRLKSQLNIMREYATILHQRIINFK